MKFLFDHCLSAPLARALNAICAPEGHQVTPQRDWIPQVDRATVRDANWLADLALDDPDWIVVSVDHGRTDKSPTEREAWRASSLRVFKFAEGFANLPKWPQVVLTMKVWPKVLEFAMRMPAGARARIPMSGTQVERLT